METLALESDGPRIAGSRVRYPEQLSVYAERFGSDERTLKRYVARGRLCDPPDLPPFHKPAEMPAWWSRRMTNRCPAGILSAASRATPPAASPPPALTAAVPSPAPLVVSSDERLSAQPSQQQPAASQPPRDFSALETLDLAANVEQLRHSLAICQRLLHEAQSTQPPDENLIATRTRNYRETFSELRKAEDALLEWQTKHGELVPRDEVRAENNRIAAAIFSAVCRLVKTVRPQLAGKTDVEQDRIWDSEVRTCFASLKTAKFTDPLPATV